MDHNDLATVILTVTEDLLSRPNPQQQGKGCFVQRDAVAQILTGLRSLAFPGYFCDQPGDPRAMPKETAEALGEVHSLLTQQIHLANLWAYDAAHQDRQAPPSRPQAEQLSLRFLKDFPQVCTLLEADVQAAYDGDPAAPDKDLIIAAYPGVWAVFVHRVAHRLYRLEVPYLPRMMSEYAHSQTGIDIHPGANIGPGFFIDHGTGVVIGETTQIGEQVKLYQGVTLGAMSTRGGQALRGKKRHPTIGNNVTIYSGASVLGGDTVIEDHVVIGGNAFITQSMTLEQSKQRGGKPV